MDTHTHAVRETERERERGSEADMSHKSQQTRSTKHEALITTVDSTMSKPMNLTTTSSTTR